MKLISAIINPLFLSEIRQDLEEAGVRSFSLRETSSVDAKHAAQEIYRGATWVTDQVSRAEITLVLSDDKVSEVVAALERRFGDGYIVICPVDRVVQPSTRRGPARLDAGAHPPHIPAKSA